MIEAIFSILFLMGLTLLIFMAAMKLNRKYDRDTELFLVDFEENEMKIVEINKPYSWLQLPVTLDGLVMSNPHLTLKYFGRVPLDPLAISKRVDKNMYLPTDKIVWRAEIFNGLARVLELTQYPAALISAHETFSIIKDQFEPWRPHITVPLEYWNVIRDGGQTPQEMNLRFGTPELYLGTEADE